MNKTRNKSKWQWQFSIAFSLVVLTFLYSFSINYETTSKAKQNTNEYPRIVNIINFIRLLAPRYPKITEDVLYQTVVKQIAIMKKYNLKGTFLIQYDVL